MVQSGLGRGSAQIQKTSFDKDILLYCIFFTGRQPMMLTAKKINELINDKRCIIIAEACDNHFGSLDRAVRMVECAAATGADIIKFQHHIPDEEMLSNVPRSSNFKSESLYEFLIKNALSIDDHGVLMQKCLDNNIHYLCTPFSLAAAVELQSFGQTVFKIGSGEFLDHWYLDKLSTFCDALIVSTGMSKFTELEFSVNHLNDLYEQLIILNCTSEYPPVYEDINLGNISIFKKKWPNIIWGHSDHTPDLFTSFAAIAKGAQVIEKHFYVDGDVTGPDSAVSISPNDLAILCEGRNKIIASLGSEKIVHNKERSIRKWAYRSIVMCKSKQAGEYISEDDIKTKRPGSGIPSKDYKLVIGKKLMRNIEKNELLKWEDIDATSIR